MLGIGALATVCEIAWQQGDDLYSALDNRLMKGFEYVAKYNWGIMFLLLCGRMSQENIATGLRYLIKEGVDICRF